MNNSDFDLDDILREFTGDPPVEKKNTVERKVSAQPQRSAPAQTGLRRSDPLPTQRSTSAQENTQPSPRRAAAQPVQNEERGRTVRQERPTPDRQSQRSAAQPPVKEEKPRRRPVPEDPVEEPAAEDYRPPKVKTGAAILSGMLFIPVILALCVWVLYNIHPNSATAKTQAVKTSADVASRFDSLVNNLASDAMSDVVYIRKLYTIPEDAAAGPAPDQAKFGETTDVNEVARVVESASELLDGQSTLWNPNIEYYNNYPVKYYCDDTILSIVWKEVVGNTVFTFAEVKIADASQLRRCLAGDAYGSSIQLKASDMAASVNAVTAMNGDFYAFRQTGIVVYKRNMERFEPSTLDSCFFTASGELLFSHRGELTDEEQTRQFIVDNDVLFSTSFGPILVENGQKYYTDGYPIGEIFEKYARSAIGTLGKFHYLLMATSSEKDGNYLAGIQVSTAADIMYDKGCIMAYELDGGQTAVIVHNGTPANEIVYGSERTMSDIIYFATAIPEEEGR